MLKQAYELGVQLALQDAGLVKESIDQSFLEYMAGARPGEKFQDVQARNLASGLGGVAAGGATGLGTAALLNRFGGALPGRLKGIAPMLPLLAGLGVGAGTSHAIGKSMGGRGLASIIPE